MILEIVEGPSAGRTFTPSGPAVLGRGDDADFVLEDDRVSRHHARVTPAGDGSATIEDLNSANGTFLNHNELIGPARLDPGDELVLGTTVIMARNPAQQKQGATVIRAVPPALATAPKKPTYVPSDTAAADHPAEIDGGQPTLERYLDVRVRRRATLAPFAMALLTAIVLVLYLLTT